MKTGTAVSYRVFVRNWWRQMWTPDGLELVPDAGARKTTIGRHMTYEEARAMCAQYSTTHNPGPLSRRAEFEKE